MEERKDIDTGMELAHKILDEWKNERKLIYEKAQFAIAQWDYWKKRAEQAENEIKTLEHDIQVEKWKR